MFGRVVNTSVGIIDYRSRYSLFFRIGVLKNFAMFTE